MFETERNWLYQRVFGGLERWNTVFSYRGKFLGGDYLSLFLGEFSIISETVWKVKKLSRNNHHSGLWTQTRGNLPSRPPVEGFEAVWNAGSNYYKFLLFNFVLKLWHTRRNSIVVEKRFRAKSERRTIEVVSRSHPRWSDLSVVFVS